MKLKTIFPLMGLMIISLFSSCTQEEIQLAIEEAEALQSKRKSQGIISCDIPGYTAGISLSEGCKSCESEKIAYSKKSALRSSPSKLEIIKRPIDEIKPKSPIAEDAKYGNCTFFVRNSLLIKGNEYYVEYLPTTYLPGTTDSCLLDSGQTVHYKYDEFGNSKCAVENPKVIIKPAPTKFEVTKVSAR